MRTDLPQLWVTYMIDNVYAIISMLFLNSPECGLWFFFWMIRRNSPTQIISFFSLWCLILSVKKRYVQNVLRMLFYVDKALLSKLMQNSLLLHTREHLPWHVCQDTTNLKQELFALWLTKLLFKHDYSAFIHSLFWGRDMLWSFFLEVALGWRWSGWPFSLLHSSDE